MFDELKIMVVAAIDEVKSRLGMKTSLDEMGQQLTVPVTAWLSKAKSRRQLKADLATLDKLYANVTTKLNVASAKKEIKAGLKKIGNQKVEIDGILKADSIKKITAQVVIYALSDFLIMVFLMVNENT